ncbi:MAG: hypothetical protein ACPGVG_17175, partial [Mycobacterium sp.]
VVATPSEAPAVRKVVATPSHAQQSWSPPTQSNVPVSANVPTGSNVPVSANVPTGSDVPVGANVPTGSNAPVNADQAVAPELAETPAQLPHLSGVQHAMGPIPGPAEALTASSVPDATESVPDTTESVPHITESSPHHLPPT